MEIEYAKIWCHLEEGRDLYFNKHLKNDLDKLIDGVMWSIKLFPNHSTYDDAKQECYFKAVRLMNDKYKMSYITSLDNYMFMLLRNTVLNYIIKMKKYTKFIYTIENQINKNNETL